MDKPKKMNKLQKLVCIGLIGVGTLALNSCAETKYETGKVIEEKEISPYMIFYPETEKKIILKDAKYLIKVETNSGIYTLDIRDYSSSSSSSEGVRTMDSLAWAIEKGDRVRFPIAKINISQTNLFGEDRIGIIYASDIEVIKNKDSKER